PAEHARRVVLELLVDEPLQPGEVEDRVEALGDLAARQAHEHAADLDVRACAELGVEADAELDERREPARDPHGSRVRAVDAGEHLQERALAAAVRPDDAEELALGNREGHLPEGVVALVRDPVERVGEVLLEPGALLVRDPERLRDAADLDRVHARSAKRGDSRRWSHRPTPSTVSAMATGRRRVSTRAVTPACVASAPSSTRRPSCITCTNGFSSTSRSAHAGRIVIGYMIGAEKKRSDAATSQICDTSRNRTYSVEATSAIPSTNAYSSRR